MAIQTKRGAKRRLTEVERQFDELAEKVADRTISTKDAIVESMLIDAQIRDIVHTLDRIEAADGE